MFAPQAMAQKKKELGSEFGQEQPPLYIYIKGILDRYPGGQIFKVRGPRLQSGIGPCDGGACDDHIS